MRTVITGTGSYIPNRIIKNSDFVNQVFFEKDHSLIDNPGEEIIRKFMDITGISERRWAEADQNNADIAAIAAEAAIIDAGIDRETIDQIIVAHNFGNVKKDTIQTDIVPSIAARVRHRLGIKNTQCVPYDVIFGCPGWIQGVIQADAFIRSGLAKRCLVIGSETLSRVVDIYDRDTMIFSDGAGAAILEANSNGTDSGIISTANMSHTDEEVDYLYYGKSNAPESNPEQKYIKMLGRKIYEYSLMYVPDAMGIALERSGESIESVKKILIHQANEKMDAAIVQRFYRKFGLRPKIDEVMPMSIRELGNSSVATIPTLYDMVLKNQLPEHQINQGDILLFASVGAGMNINAFVYKQ
ncbi:MAG: ketoacyl-ACP synthase III [Bacteroidetes bacterium]|nr:ketoacyl-ACP synthase III [Bacteroidota bacterium]MBU1578898.1 ketoacyl-ACP synthase III [Bacteroidota bacterium]MBU2559053.1 ketoacyl-ACP synthase III [Bacteroidota bacterium]MDA3944614.1 ketoacyl-ACP synthase III [Bacteroidota bacterium]